MNDNHQHGIGSFSFKALGGFAPLSVVGVLS
jgi:hypothetical protein